MKFLEHYMIEGDVVYHGTNKDFSEFDDSNGVWFISDKEAAEDYGDRIIPARLDIRNPYVSSHKENMKLGMRKLIAKAKSKNHDSIILPKDKAFYDEHIHDEALHDVYVVFNKDQINEIR